MKGKAVNVDEVLKILWKYGEFILVTESRKYSDMVDEIANLKALEQGPCEDCISREDALMCMTGEYIADKTYKPEDIISKHIQRLRALPPVTPQPGTGHWIIGKYKDTCSNCRCTYPKNIGFKNYCPNCGAKMESEG